MSSRLKHPKSCSHALLTSTACISSLSFLSLLEQKFTHTFMYCSLTEKAHWWSTLRIYILFEVSHIHPWRVPTLIHSRKERGHPHSLLHIMSVHKPHQAQAPHSVCWGPASAPVLWPPPDQECTTLDCSCLVKWEVMAGSLQGHWNSAGLCCKPGQSVSGPL